MRAYVVRLVKNRDLVGIFAVENVDQLINLIDECTEAQSCEYASLGPGGVYWSSPAIEVPVPEPASGDNDNDEDNPDRLPPRIPWQKAEMTQFWDMLLCGVEPLKWKPISEEQVIEALFGDVE